MDIGPGALDVQPWSAHWLDVWETARKPPETVAFQQLGRNDSRTPARWARRWARRKPEWKFLTTANLPRSAPRLKVGLRLAAYRRDGPTSTNAHRQYSRDRLSRTCLSSWEHQRQPAAAVQRQQTCWMNCPRPIRRRCRPTTDPFDLRHAGVAAILVGLNRQVLRQVGRLKKGKGGFEGPRPFLFFGAGGGARPPRAPVLPDFQVSSMAWRGGSRAPATIGGASGPVRPYSARTCFQKREEWFISLRCAHLVGGDIIEPQNGGGRTHQPPGEG